MKGFKAQKIISLFVNEIFLSKLILFIKLDVV